MKLKILIYDIGSTESDIIYPLKIAFESIGHEVKMFDWTKYLYTYKNRSLQNRIKDRVLFNLISFKVNERLKEIIKENSFDIFLVVRGDHIFSETILFAKQTIRKVVNWNSDDIFNKLNSSKFILDSFDKYDIHFSPRLHLKEEYLAKGAKSVRLLNWYYRLGLLYPESPVSNSQFLNPACFVGSWSQRREDFLSSLNDVNLEICGWGWDKRKKLAAIDNWTFSTGVSMKDMMYIFSRTKINVNILTKENRDTTNLRNFEIPAAGAFQLAERSEALLELFEEDVEIVCFENSEELASKCKFYLKNDNIRNKIAAAGYQRLVRGNNSLIDRVKQIADICSE